MSYYKQKKCQGCGKRRMLRFFHRSGKAKDGLSKKCVDCSKKRGRRKGKSVSDREVNQALLIAATSSIPVEVSDLTRALARAMKAAGIPYVAVDTMRGRVEVMEPRTYPLEDD